MAVAEDLGDLEARVEEQEIRLSKLHPLLQVIPVITVLLVQEVRPEAVLGEHLIQPRYLQEAAAQVTLMTAPQETLFNHFRCIHHQVMQVPLVVIQEEAEAVAVLVLPIAVVPPQLAKPRIQPEPVVVAEQVVSLAV